MKVGAARTFATDCWAYCGRRATAASPATTAPTTPHRQPRPCVPSWAAHELRFGAGRGAQLTNRPLLSRHGLEHEPGLSWGNAATAGNVMTAKRPTARHRRQEGTADPDRRAGPGRDMSAGPRASPGPRRPMGHPAGAAHGGAGGERAGRAQAWQEGEGRGGRRVRVDERRRRPRALRRRAVLRAHGLAPAAAGLERRRHHRQPRLARPARTALHDRGCGCRRRRGGRD